MTLEEIIENHGPLDCSGFDTYEATASIAREYVVHVLKKIGAQYDGMHLFSSREDNLLWRFGNSDGWEGDSIDTLLEYIEGRQPKEAAAMGINPPPKSIPDSAYKLESCNDAVLLRKIVADLWQLLDDIDTTSDMVKDNDKAYRARAERIQLKRWEQPITSDGYDLFITG